MRNPIETLGTKVKTSVKSGVQERVRTHFEENKRTYIACASTAAVVFVITSRKPVINVTVVNNLP